MTVYYDYVNNLNVNVFQTSIFIMNNATSHFRAMSLYIYISLFRLKRG